MSYDIDEEKWVMLYEYELYEVSNLGRIRSKERKISIGNRGGIECFRTREQQIKKLRTNNIDPHLFTDIPYRDSKGNKKQKTIYIHRAVADHFVKKTPANLKALKEGKHLYASHKVKDYENNRWDNIKFITHDYLMKHQPNRLKDPTKAWKTRRKIYGKSGSKPKENTEDNE